MGKSVQNWIDQLGITTIQLKASIERFYVLQRLVEQPTNSFKHIDVYDAWKTIDRSVRRRLPMLEDKSFEIFKANNYEANSQKSGAPFCRDNGADEIPHIEVVYKGEFLDVINLAHEYFHALQFVWNHSHNSSEPIHPLIKEVFAFIGEMCVLSMLVDCNDSDNSLWQYWEYDNHIYAVHADEIFEKLPDLRNTDYQYRFNYPTARWIAYTIWTSTQRERWIERLFGKPEVANDLISEILDIALSRTNRLPNYKPADVEPNSLNAYRSLGTMVLSDIELRDGVAKMSVGKYYQRSADALKSNSVYIGLNQDHQVVGYAIVSTAQNFEYQIFYQAAPFGEYDILHYVLQQKLNNDLGVMTAHHDRSARRKQVAWLNQ